LPFGERGACGFQFQVDARNKALSQAAPKNADCRSWCDTGRWMCCANHRVLQDGFVRDTGLLLDPDSDEWPGPDESQKLLMLDWPPVG